MYFAYSSKSDILKYQFVHLIIVFFWVLTFKGKNMLVWSIRGAISVAQLK